MKYLLRLIAPISLSILVSGCIRYPLLHPATYEQRVLMAGQEPTEEQAGQAAMKYLQEKLKDPDSVKQFSVFQSLIPIRWAGGNQFGAGWLVCFQYNAKNSYGGYVGVKKDSIAVRMIGGEAVAILGVTWETVEQRCY